MKKHKKKRRTIEACMICIVILVIACKGSCTTIVGLWNDLQDNLLEASSDKKEEDSPFQMETSLHSNNAILLHGERELMATHKDKRIYPASMTKIMTAILVIEEFSDLDQKAVVPNDIFTMLEEEQASVAGFQAGEKVSIRDLLYGVLLPSGADACMTLAQAVAGTQSQFVEKMNEKAKQLGLSNTHFMNCTGLHHQRHYSTVKDIAQLLSYAWKNETFQTIFIAKEYTTQPDQVYTQGLYFMSTLQSGLELYGLDNPYIIGAKTGYTPEAGLCMASISRINGEEYMFVTAHANGDVNSTPYHILDALHMNEELAAF